MSTSLKLRALKTSNEALSDRHLTRPGLRARRMWQWVTLVELYRDEQKNCRDVMDYCRAVTAGDAVSGGASCGYSLHWLLLEPTFFLSLCLCDTADIVCGVRWQTCLLCRTADVSAVLQSRHVCCVTCHKGGMCAVPRSIHVCCFTQQTCLLGDTTGMSAV